MLRCNIILTSPVSFYFFFFLTAGNRNLDILFHNRNAWLVFLSDSVRVGGHRTILSPAPCFWRYTHSTSLHWRAAVNALS